MSARSQARSKLRVVAALGIAALVLPAFNACQFFGGRPGGDGPVVLPDASWNSCPPDGSTGTCHPDPGSTQVDCSVADGIETLTIEDFNTRSTSGQFDGFLQAHDMYIYTDGTSLSVGNLAPVRYETNPDVFEGVQVSAVKPPTQSCDQSVLDQISSWHPAISGWQPPATIKPLCKPGPYGNGMLHVVGGPFLAWGGGVGVSMAKLNGRNPEAVPGNVYVDRYLYPAIDTTTALCIPGGANYRPELCPPDTDEYAARIASIDVSSFDGVSFWARRGPGSQGGIRVMVGDRYTDDDLNFLTQEHNKRTGSHDKLYCQRIKACGCSYGGDCKYTDDGGHHWCQDPCSLAAVSECDFQGLITAGAIVTDTGSPQQSGGTSNCLCGQADTCNAPYAAFAQSYGSDPMNAKSGIPENLPDPQFYGKPCTPYSFADGDGTSYCFDPAEGPPAPGSERCGDFWMKGVSLSTDWTFYKIPFTDLRQQGWAKKFDSIDLHHVTVARFTWETGNIDYFIDDFSFYKNKK